MPDQLELEIRRLVSAGYQVTNRTATTAQLVRKKQFNLVAACLWLLVFGFGVLLYCAYYLSRSDDLVYLALDADGSLARPGFGNGNGMQCPSCGYRNSRNRLSCKSCRAPLLKPAA